MGKDLDFSQAINFLLTCLYIELTTVYEPCLRVELRINTTAKGTLVLMFYDNRFVFTNLVHNV